MQTLTAQLSTLSDFFTSFDLGNLVAKDALGNIDLTRDALVNPVLLGGRLRATILETGGLVIEVADPLAPTIGTAEVLPIAIDADSDGDDDYVGFKIRLSAPITAPVKVDWLLVEQKDVIAP